MSEKDPDAKDPREKGPDENDPGNDEHSRWSRSALDAETARMMAVKEEMSGKLASIQEKIRTLQSMNPDRPWLALDDSIASSQRTIDTLRAGTLRPADSDADPLEMANTIEGRLQYWQLVVSMAGEFSDLAEQLSEEHRKNEASIAELLQEIDEAERARPSARIADAEERQRARRLHRARRGALTGGKPRRGPGGGKK
jgi:hypothetical protein